MTKIYVKHPVTAEQKAKLKSKGKILDAKFAPAGAEILDADGKKWTAPKKDAQKDGE